MKDKITQRFKELDGQFDTEEPAIGHFDRFEAKLAKQGSQSPKWNPKTWTWIAVAASLALLFGFWFGDYNAKQGLELADVSPEMEETQSWFVASIQSEIEKVNLKRNEDNQKIIDDAFLQLEKLEADYGQLTIELEGQEANKGIIYAMVSNFQQRIEVLQNLLEQLEELQQLKTLSNEETII